MNNTGVIFESIELIEESLFEPVSVISVADRFGYSWYHFGRLFKGVTGHTPKEYIQRRRLSEAARRIASSREKIIDIALTCGFQNHEHFSRSFKRYFGMNPTDLRRPGAASFPFFERIRVPGARRSPSQKEGEPDIVELGPLVLAGLSTFVGENTRVISELWGLVMEEAERAFGPEARREWHQLAFWPEHVEWRGFFCLAGMAVGSAADAPMSMVVKRVPAARYLRFVHVGQSHTVESTYRHIYERWLPDSEYKPALAYNMERCGERFLGPFNEESETDILIPICAL